MPRVSRVTSAETVVHDLLRDRRAVRYSGVRAAAVPAAVGEMVTGAG
jgi:hypothetical protein